MRHDGPGRARGPRALAAAARVLCVAVLGIVTLVGSGGGGFPDCTAPFCSDTSPPPLPTVAVQPEYLTAQVGSPVQFSAEVMHYPAAVTYQWQRSVDSGGTWADIPGATASSYALAGVNLSDDGAWFHVTVRSPGSVTLGATGRLVVSATPGLVYADGEFRPADWTVSAAAGPNPTHPAHSEEVLAAGGNPGAYRRMTFTLGADAGTGYVLYLSNLAVYQPQLQGGIRVIDYAEDCVALPAIELKYTESSLLVEQAGRTYLARVNGTLCNQAAWRTVMRRASLGADDFYLFDGPACGAAEACPDFSALAAPLRFGHARTAYGQPGDVIGHGIDNWSVTVWRR